MRRLFTKEKISDTLTLTGTDAHHVGYALRGKVGERYTVVDDYGTVAVMEAAAFRENEVDLRLVEYADGSYRIADKHYFGGLPYKGRKV